MTLDPFNKKKMASFNYYQNFLGGTDGKESVCTAGDLDSIPGLRRSSGERNIILFKFLKVWDWLFFP